MGPYFFSVDPARTKGTKRIFCSLCYPVTTRSCPGPSPSSHAAFRCVNKRVFLGASPATDESSKRKFYQTIAERRNFHLRNIRDILFSPLCLSACRSPSRDIAFFAFLPFPLLRNQLRAEPRPKKMRLPSTNPARIKNLLHGLQGFVIFLAWAFTIAVFTRDGGTDGRTAWYFAMVCSRL